MSKPQASTTITLPQMVDLALNSPEVTINKKSLKKKFRVIFVGGNRKFHGPAFAAARNCPTIKFDRLQRRIQRKRRRKTTNLHPISQARPYNYTHGVHNGPGRATRKSQKT